MTAPSLQSLMQIVDPGTGQPHPFFVQSWNNLLQKAIKAVPQKSTPTWATPTGILSRTTFTAYAGQTVSNPPTQAQVQALDDALKAHSQHLAALITDLRTVGVLT